MRVFVFLLLTACGKMDESAAVCVAPQATQDCDSGAVLLIETDGGSSGTLSTCHVCTLGTACTFQSNGSFVDGVCQ